MWIPLLALVSCLPCHEAIVRSFASTAMGKSIARPVAEARPNQAGRHGNDDWAVTSKAGVLTHRAGGKIRTMDWAIGSGHEGKSYLYRVGDALFQSPLAWYTRRGEWDLSPGYAADRTIDFLRPVTADCLFCHSGASKPIAGTVNRYAVEDPIPAITCTRCHGAGDTHLRDARRGNIVNPARLPDAKRDSICEQCHLSGVARVPLPGKSFADFRPGLQLEEVFSVYVPESYREFKVVSHAEQLALSECAKASGGRLWCGSCHDPHREPADAKGWYREHCQTCHTQTRPHGDNCAGCHMPRTMAHDGGHAAFTDHRIRKPGPEAAKVPALTALRAWREPAASWRERGLGLAYAGTGDLEKAYALLRGLAADAEVQGALGLIHLRSGRTAMAVQLLESAVRADPASATRHLNLAAALLAAGNLDRAKAEARRALDLEPLLQDAYVLLAEIEPRRAAYWKRELERRMHR